MVYEPLHRISDPHTAFFYATLRGPPQEMVYEPLYRIPDPHTVSVYATHVDHTKLSKTM